MIQFQNAIIRASAGSGKTYELVKRYLRLLAMGESPEGIVAMTFTRKAAREFFERILQKLAELAEHPERAVGYVDEIENAEHSMRLLRKVIDSMDRLRLGTIDSFFASVARCFPFELGLAGQASIMPEDETSQARLDVMSALMVEVTRDKDGDALREMLEAWKRATAGAELNRPSEYLDAWFNRLHNLYLEAPDAKRWGGLEAIWPHQSAPVWKAEEDLSKAIETLRDVLDVEQFGKGDDVRWDKFYQASLDRRPGEPVKTSSPFEYMLKKDRCEFGELPLLRQGRAQWKMGKKTVAFDHRVGNALADVLDIVVGRELLCRSERTQGRRDVVGRFDHEYNERVRSRGRLAFADLTWLLSGHIKALDDLKKQGPTATWESMRLNWEYRLDCRFQHWLFDEFQDTSRRQWDVVKNLVDEAVFDDEHRRSFFAVGDLKQSLYLWRQAEPELFLDIEEEYKDSRMEKRAPLSTSYRSSGSVLGMVNAIFTQHDLLKQTYPAAIKWWNFESHLGAGANAKKPGHAALLSAPKVEGQDDTVARDELVAALIRHIAPLERDLSCVVLTRSNAEAQRVSAELRRLLNVDVVCESQVPVAMDNPATLVLQSVLQLAAHPDDGYAKEHLRMSPLGNYFIEHGKNSVSVLGGEVRRQVAEEGFLAVVKQWAGRLQEIHRETNVPVSDDLFAKAEKAEPAKVVWDDFTTFRLGQFFDLAAAFDQQGSRDIDAFLRFVRDFRMRTTDQGKALQVMTIHMSKGLEFDVVIMPHLQGTALDQGIPSRDGESLLIQRDEEGEVAWLLDKPQSLFCERDNHLKAAVNQEKARLAYQGLCRLYVGMTRAKRGLYLILPAKGNARSEVDFVQQALAKAKPDVWEWTDEGADCWYETGDRNWFVGEVKTDKEPIVKPVASSTEKLGDIMRRRGVGMLQRRAPSSEESFVLKGTELLSARRETQRNFGTLVHLLFSELPWLDGFDDNAIRDVWSQRGLQKEAAFAEAENTVLNSLAQPKIRAWFELAGASRESWKERPFDMVLEDQWVSGVFDRVVVERNVSGEMTSATIVDFKTDDVRDDKALQDKAQGYAPQLKLYRKAVQRLTGLALENVKAVLVFTFVAKVVEVNVK